LVAGGHGATGSVRRSGMADHRCHRAAPPDAGVRWPLVGRAALQDAAPRGW